MRILVISDTHGKLAGFWDIFKKLKRENAPDVIVHCGDYYRDSEEIRRRTGVPVFAVKGNCDRDFSENGYMIFETEAGSFLITHGHLQNVKYSMQNLYYKTLEENCAGAFFGHTHRKAYLNMDGVHLVNPGSLSQPRDGSRGSFAIVETSASGVWVKIYDCADFMAAKENKPEIAAAENKPAVEADSGANSSDENASKQNHSESCGSKACGEPEDGTSGGSKANNSESDSSGEPDHGKCPSGGGTNTGGGQSAIRKGSKVIGGKLRKLLNYSDRF